MVGSTSTHVSKPRHEAEHEHAVLHGRHAARRRRRPTFRRTTRRPSRSGPYSPPYHTGTSSVAPSALRDGFAARTLESCCAQRATSAVSGSNTPPRSGRSKPHRARRRSRARFNAAAMPTARALTRRVDHRREAPAGAPSRPPRGCERRSRSERLKELAVNTAKAAVRHQHDHVPLAMLGDDSADDIVDVGDMARVAARAREDRPRAARPTDAPIPEGSSGTRRPRSPRPRRRTRRRSRPGTHGGTKRPTAARTPPRCGGPDTRCAAPRAFRERPSDDGRSRRAR